MKKILSLVLFAITLTACHAQQPVRIDFTTSTRGYQKQISITPQAMTTTIENARIAENTKKQETKLKKGDWKKLIAALKDVPLSEIPGLPSPTMNRASDGARSSTLVITTKGGNTYAHTFDNENPDKKLMPLMKAIVSLEP